MAIAHTMGFNRTSLYIKIKGSNQHQGIVYEDTPIAENASRAAVVMGCAVVQPGRCSIGPFRAGDRQ